MTIAQISGFILLALMVGIVYMATKFVSEVRYKGHGIYFLTINGFFRKQAEYKEWLRDNKVYHWCILLILGLCASILMLIPPFSRNEMLVRPEAALFVNLAVWIPIFKTYQWFFKKLGLL